MPNDRNDSSDHEENMIRIAHPSSDTSRDGPSGADSPEPSPDDQTRVRPPGGSVTTIANEAPGYEVLGTLGEGGMGRVYLARDTRLNRKVALKTLRVTNGSADFVARFWAEAEVMAIVDHPHVVKVFELSKNPSHPFMAMEYLTGGSLRDRLARGPAFSPQEAAELMEKVARGLAAAHRLGIVHRDLKPANVLLAEDGEPKVADFGLAKHGANDLTQTRALMGTPNYMSPEQADGRAKFVGPSADVWALGVILYECLAGKLPFDGESLESVLRKIMSAEPEPLHARFRGVPRDLATIVAKCLSKEPQHRYATADELADELARFRRREPITARPVRAWERAIRWARRNPAVSALTGGVVFSLAVGLGVSAWFAAHYRNASNRLDSALKAAERREGPLAIERGVALCERGDEATGLLWMARGIELLDRHGPETHDSRAARLQFALWSQKRVVNRTALAIPHAFTDELPAWERNNLHAAAKRIHLSPDGRSVFVAHPKGVVRYDSATGRHLQRFTRKNDNSAAQVARMFLGDQGARLVVFSTVTGWTLGDGGVVSVYSLANSGTNGSPEWEFTASEIHEVDPTLTVAVSFSQTRRALEVWDIQRQHSVVARQWGALTGWTPSRSTVVMLSPDRSVFTLTDYETRSKPFGGAVSTPFLALHRSDSSEVVWQASQPPPEWGLQAPVSCFSPDGQKLLCVTPVGVQQVEVRNGAVNPPLFNFPFQPRAPASVRFSRSSDWLVVRLMPDGRAPGDTVRAWNWPAGTPWPHRDVDPDHVSPDGSFAFVANRQPVSWPSRTPLSRPLPTEASDIVFTDHPRVVLVRGTEGDYLWDCQGGRQVGPVLGRFAVSSPGTADRAPGQYVYLDTPLQTPTLVRWRVVPAEGCAERLQLHAQVITGSELDDEGRTRTLSPEEMADRKARLEALGGPLLP